MEQQLWEKAIAFHGHACPGLAIGVRAATEAIKRSIQRGLAFQPTLRGQGIGA